MKIQDRVTELRRVPASELVPNPRNWRQHPEAQLQAIRGVMNEIGFAGAELARELPDGSLMLIDGHARSQVAGDAVVPVLILDVDEQEADKLLATFDPLGAMATADGAVLESLLNDVETDDEAVAQLLASLLGQTDKAEKPEQDGVILEKLTCEGYEPRHEVEYGDCWILGDRHALYIVDLINDWQPISEALVDADDDAMFVPYAGPLVPLSVAAKLKPMILVQPVLFVAATLLDWWVDAHGEGSAVKQ